MRSRRGRHTPGFVVFLLALAVSLGVHFSVAAQKAGGADPSILKGTPSMPIGFQGP